MGNANSEDEIEAMEEKPLQNSEEAIPQEESNIEKNETIVQEESNVEQNETIAQEESNAEKNETKVQDDATNLARAYEILSGMTMEEKVLQMFMITPEALTGYSKVTSAKDVTKQSLHKYPVGGIIYFASNIQTPDQLKTMTQDIQSYAMERSGLPLFLGIDEEGDTHKGFAYTNQSLEELFEEELVPFQAAVDHKLPFIMVSHISVPTVIGDDTPSSISKVMIQDILRNKMGYEGIVITDAMNMGAIINHYGSEDAVIQAIQAGV